MQQHKGNDRTETVVVQWLDHKEFLALPLTSDLGSRNTLNQYALRQGAGLVPDLLYQSGTHSCQMFVQDNDLTR